MKLHAGVEINSWLLLHVGLIVRRFKAIAVVVNDEDRLALVVLDLILLGVVFLVTLVPALLSLILRLLFLPLALLTGLSAVLTCLPLRLIRVLI